MYTNNVGFNSHNFKLTSMIMTDTTLFSEQHTRKSN